MEKVCCTVYGPPEAEAYWRVKGLRSCVASPVQIYSDCASTGVEKTMSTDCGWFELAGFHPVDVLLSMAMAAFWHPLVQPPDPQTF